MIEMSEECSVEDELFGDDYSNHKMNQCKLEKPPSYFYEQECKQFLQDENIKANSDYGFASIHLLKNYYFPGQTVRGFVFLNLFNDAPSKVIMLRVRGKECPGRFSKQIRKKLQEDPESFKDHLYTLNASHSGFKVDTTPLQQDFQHTSHPRDVTSKDTNTQKFYPPLVIGELSISAKVKKISAGKTRSNFYKNLEPSTTPQSPQMSQMNGSMNMGDTKHNELLPKTKKMPHAKQSANKIEILESIFTLSKKETKTRQNRDSLRIFDNEVESFNFKGNKFEKGCYKFPFSFNLPSNIPGSFKYKNSTGDSVEITYSIEVYMLNLQDKIYCRKDIDVKEFLFTDKEIDIDWMEYQKVLNIRSVFAPISSLEAAITQRNSDQKLQFAKQNEINRSQSIRMHNKLWTKDHEIISARCLCFQTHYYVKLRASINKQLFYPNEIVKISFEVDNSRNARDIKMVTCTLTHNLTIMKGSRVVQDLDFDLKLIQFKGVTKGCVQNTKEFIFDLDKIFSEYKQAGAKLKGVDKNEIQRRKKEIIERVSVKRESKNGPISPTEKFQRQLSKFLETTDEFTFLTVNGISIKSSFTVDVSFTVNDVFGSTVHEKKFPITIRSEKNGKFIHENDLLERRWSFLNEKDDSYYQKLPKFIQDMECQMFSLPGCNFQIALGNTTTADIRRKSQLSFLNTLNK